MTLSLCEKERVSPCEKRQVYLSLCLCVRKDIVSVSVCVRKGGHFLSDEKTQCLYASVSVREEMITFS